MNNLIVVTALFVGLVFLLTVFSIFIIGFLIGYIRQDKKLKRDKSLANKARESDDEIKAKKEWKRFLQYDGSNSQENI